MEHLKGSKTDIERFHAGYVIDPQTGCWVWQKNIQRSGYGHMKYEGDAHSVHRLAYEFFVGDIPPKLHVLHKCDNKRCVNPQHLFLGTALDNMRDMHAKGRHAHGERVNTAKLTEKQVLEIYDLSDAGMGAPKIGKLFDISTTMAWNIKTGRSWTHLYNARYRSSDS